MKIHFIDRGRKPFSQAARSKTAETIAGGGDGGLKSKPTRGRAEHPDSKPPTDSAQPARRTKLPREFLDQISNQVLEHTKQLGLFDELRMRLLSRIEARREFPAIEREFCDEIQSFCRRRLDLKEPRARLRQQLNDHVQNQDGSRLSRNLSKSIEHIVGRHRDELTSSYHEKASLFLGQYRATPEKAASEPLAEAQHSPTPADATDQDHSLDLDQIPLPPPPPLEPECGETPTPGPTKCEDAPAACEPHTDPVRTTPDEELQSNAGLAAGVELCLGERACSSESPPNSSTKSVDSGFSTSSTVNSTPTAAQTPSPPQRAPPPPPPGDTPKTREDSRRHAAESRQTQRNPQTSSGSAQAKPRESSAARVRNDRRSRERSELARRRRPASRDSAGPLAVSPASPPRRGQKRKKKKKKKRKGRGQFARALLEREWSCRRSVEEVPRRGTGSRPLSADATRKGATRSARDRSAVRRRDRSNRSDCRASRRSRSRSPRRESRSRSPPRRLLPIRERSADRPHSPTVATKRSRSSRTPARTRRSRSRSRSPREARGNCRDEKRPDVGTRRRRPNEPSSDRQRRVDQQATGARSARQTRLE